jgi:hypothetical protein
MMDPALSVTRWVFRIAFRVMRRLARLVAKLMVVVLVVLLRAPWLLVRAAVTGAQVFVSATRLPGAIVAASRDVAHCRRCGHAQQLLGSWRCPVCKGVETTHAWARCSVCGTDVPAGFVGCDVCGEAIVNPRLRGIR